MQLNLPSNSRFETEWSIDMDRVKTVIESCIVSKQLFQAGEYLFRQGSKLPNLVLIGNGTISMGYNASNGKSFQIGTIECDNHIFGELEFLSDFMCQVDIVAVDALEAFIIDIKKLKASLLKEPIVTLFFAKYVALDYQSSVDVFFSRLVYSISYNIALELYQSHHGSSAFLGFSKQYLEAERFGTTDRVYRRALQKLEKLGLIERTRNGIKVTDYQLLKSHIDEMKNTSNS